MTAAITTEAKLDARKLRADFPIFQRHFHGKPLLHKANTTFGIGRVRGGPGETGVRG